MAIGDLNVRIGATIKGLQTGLKSAERELKNFSRTTNSLGNSLTLGLSAPLAAFGALSLQAAGDIEALGLALNSAFKNQGRTVEEARLELEALREVAKAPGIDFEQAIRSSIQLQAVGFTAETARKSIEQLANVIATGGGTADNFGEVNRQFTQIIGKNKILQEDIKIILGNAPALAAVFQDAFGGVTAEQIVATGVTAREFVEKTITELEKLDRVQGGISNSFVNFRTTLKNALATVGLEINRALNVQGNVDKFSGFIDQLAATFKNLEDSTIRSTLNFGIFLLSIGPIIKGVGLLTAGVAAVIPYLKSFIAFLPVIAGAGAKLVAFFQLAASGSLGFSVAMARLTAVFAGFNLVAAASIIGAIAVAVVLAANAYKNWAREIQAAGAGQRVLNEVQSEAIKSIADEKAKVTELTAIVKDETRSKKERGRALDDLKGISEKYFGVLDIEKSKTGEIDLATREYTKAIIENARVQAARNKLVEIEGRLLDSQQQGIEARPTILQNIANSIKSLGSPYGLAERTVGTFTDNLAANVKALELQKEALLGVLKPGAEADFKARAPTVTPKADKAKTPEVQTTGPREPVPIEVPFIPTLTLSTDDFDLSSIARVTDTLKTEFDKLPGTIKNTDDSILGLTERINTDMAESFRGIRGEVQALDEAMQKNSSVLTESKIQVLEVAAAMADAGERISNAIATGISNGLAAFGEALGSFAAGVGKAANLGYILLDALLGIVQEVGKILIQLGIGLIAVQIALESLNPYVAIAAGVALIALASYVRSSLKKQGGQIQEFATGGIVTAPTIGLVGEAGPEAIIPLRKLPDMIGDSNQMEFTTRLAGDDLYLIMQRAQTRKNRIG